MSEPGALADRLLDAHVAYALAQLQGEKLLDRIDTDVREVLTVLDDVRLDAVISADEVSRIVQRSLATVPGSVAAGTLLGAAADMLYDGPDEPIVLRDVVDRAQVEIAVDHLLGLVPALERGLDTLSDSPMVGTVASQFISRIVLDVVQANRSMAEKIPGVGSIMSIGTSAASKVIGAADGPLQQLAGDATGKGAAFAMRRLNKVIIQTLRDPSMRAALLDIWDRVANQPIEGLDSYMSREDVDGAAGTAQRVVADGASSPAVQDLADRIVRAFFEIYGEYSITTLLGELAVDIDDVIADLQAVVPRVVAAWQVDGGLETVIRARLSPFYASADVRAILTDN